MQGDKSDEETSLTTIDKKQKGAITESKSIADIISSQSNFPITVMVIRLFKVAKRGCPGRYNSCDFIAIDEEGDRIHCVIKESLMRTFDHVLEGKTYEMSNYGVAFNTTRFKFVPHKYKIVIYRDTKMDPKPAVSISRFGFKFVYFNDVNNNSLDKHILIDVIGVMVGIEEIVQWKNSKEQSKSIKKEGIKLNVQLMDLRKNIITCTFWDSFTKHFTPYLGCTSKDAIVVILQFGMFGNFNGPVVSNGYDGTKVIIDDNNVYELYDFKERFKKLEGEGVTVSHISSEIVLSEREIFLNPGILKSVKKISDELNANKQVFKAVVFVTTDRIEERNGWYYNSCRVCKCKLKDEEPNKFWCNKCKSYEEYTIPRFCIQFSIIDDSGSAEVTMFETAATKFFKKTVTEILDNIEKDSDYSSIPEELNELLNKTMLFHLGITEYNVKNLPLPTTYIVLLTTKEPSIIQDFEKLALEEEVIHHLFLLRNILLRNIDQSAGLVNGTRLIITDLGKHVIKGRIISGNNIGHSVLIPRMSLTPTDSRLPFKFMRRQFPISVCFAMTINKSQGQSLASVGIYLPRAVFAHGQLYVACSRVTSKKGLKILVCDKEGRRSNTTTNVVFKEVFNNV